MKKLAHGMKVTFLPITADYYEQRLARMNGKSLLKTGTFLEKIGGEHCKILNENNKIEFSHIINTRVAKDEKNHL